MKGKIIVALALIMGLAAGSAEAQVSSRRHQNDRIHHGIRSGELNRYEKQRLIKEQRKIKRMKHHYRKNDGRLSPRERRMLQLEKRRHSQKIYRYKHNRFDRY